MKRPQTEQLKAVPAPLENGRRAARKPERETFAVYRLPDDGDDASAEREFLLTLPVDVDVERRIKRDYGAGSYRVERRRGGRYVSVYELHLDEPPQREEETGARYGGVPEDLEERIAQAVDEVLESRRAERARARALRPNPSPTVQPQQTTTVDPLNDLVRTVAVLKQLGVPIGETARPAATAAAKDDDDHVLLSLLKDRNLRQRISTSITSLIGDPDASAPQAWYVQVMQSLESQPQLTARLLSLVDRVFPNKEESDDSDDDESEAVDLEDACMRYLMEKCVANEPITLNDEPIRALAESKPEGYKEFIGLMQLASVEQAMTYLSQEFEVARIPLRAPHAREWFTRLKELAATVT
jgi:hypothetical protein